jgi:putative transcriptional regulator
VLPRARSSAARCGARRAATWRIAAAGTPPEGDDDAPPELPADWRDFRCAAGHARGRPRALAAPATGARAASEVVWRAACPCAPRLRSARLVATEQSEDGDGAPTAAAAAADAAAAARRARWAHAVAAPETGCLLLASPAHFTASQPYFHRACIFLFDHSEQGSAGLILNRRTEYKLGTIAGSAPFLPEFAEAPLFLGGDVGKSSLHLLHADAPDALPTGRRVVRGVAMGGFDGAAEAVRTGALRTEDFRFFTRYCGWAPGQLADECAAGVWFLAAASADVVLALPPDEALRPGREQAAATPRGGGLWADVLRLMGGEYAAMAQAALDVEEQS